MAATEIEGQLSKAERDLITSTLISGANKPEVVIEVGTWLGGGSTLHILRALQANGYGHLWGVEYDRSIYDRMIVNLQSAVPEALSRFTPLFGPSEEVIPAWLRTHPSTHVDFAFLDGGDNPRLQVNEFKLFDPRVPVGGQLMAHDARVRKGKWFVPFLHALDHWKCEVLDLSEVGLLVATKIAPEPSPQSQREAEKLLKRLRWQFPEVAARFLPPKLREVVAKMLPSRFIARVMRKGA